MSPNRKPLSPQMVKALQHLANGDSRPIAARRMRVSVQTLKDYLKVAYFRLNVHKLAAAIAEGFRRGLLK